jgi:hypothetical protein
MHVIPGLCLRTDEASERAGMDVVEMDESVCDYRDDPEANPEPGAIPMAPVAAGRQDVAI